MPTPNSISDLQVTSVSYLVGRDGVHALTSAPSGTRWTLLAGTEGDEPAKVDKLRRELRNPDSVSDGYTPRLEEFTEGWGRALFPPEILATPPDVLVIVPHGWLHDLPLHLVRCDGGPLGTLCGVTHASSHTLFLRCADRNRRRKPGDDGRFDPAPPWTGPLRNRSAIIAGDVKSPDDRLVDTVARAVAGMRSGGRFRHDARSIRFNRGAGLDDLPESPDALCLVAHGWIDPEDRLGLRAPRARGHRAQEVFPGYRLREKFQPPIAAFRGAARGAGRGEGLRTAFGGPA